MTTTIPYAADLKQRSVSTLDVAAGHILLTAAHPRSQSAQSFSCASFPPASPAPAPIRRTKSKHHPYLVAVWDTAWRAHYRFIATFGISVMEPWERAFALGLFAALIALAVLAATRVPALTTYLAARVSYFLPRASATAVQVGGGNATRLANVASGLPAVDVNLCHRLLQLLAADSNASFPINAGQTDHPFLTPFSQP